MPVPIFLWLSIHAFKDIVRMLFFSPSNLIDFKCLRNFLAVLTIQTRNPFVSQKILSAASAFLKHKEFTNSFDNDNCQLN